MKFSNGQNTLDLLLDNQKHIHDKSGTAFDEYNIPSSQKSDSLSSTFVLDSKSHKHSSVIRFCCGKSDHMNNACPFKNTNKNGPRLNGYLKLLIELCVHSGLLSHL